MRGSCVKAFLLISIFSLSIILLGSMSDRNDNTESNTESICIRKTTKTTKTTTNINSTASKKSDTHSKQEMQQTDCDIQRDPLSRTTTTKLSNIDNKSKDSISSDTLTSDSNNNNNDNNEKMQKNYENYDENEQSVDDECSQSDSPIDNRKQEHNKANNNTITVNVNNETNSKDESFGDENASRNGTAKKKVQVRQL
jgi:hypothetical protein